MVKKDLFKEQNITIAVDTEKEDEYVIDWSTIEDTDNGIIFKLKKNPNFLPQQNQ